MGVVNVTPDSFSDGGHVRRRRRGGRARPPARAPRARRSSTSAASPRARAPRPCPPRRSCAASCRSSRDRRPRRRRQISIDTMKLEVAEAARRRGRDLRQRRHRLPPRPRAGGPGRRPRARLLPDAHARRAAHDAGRPALRRRRRRRQGVPGGAARGRGRRRACPRSAIQLDPGIGFGKTLEHNLELLRRLDEIAAIGRPLVLGTSRKIVPRPPHRPRRRPSACTATVATCVLALRARGARVPRPRRRRGAPTALAVAAATLRAGWP